VKRGKTRTRRGSRRLRAPLWFTGLLAVLLAGWFLFQPETRQREVVRLVGSALERDKRVSLIDVAWDLYQLYYGNDTVATPHAQDPTAIYGFFRFSSG